MSFYYPDESYAKTTYDLDQQRYGNPYAGQQQYQQQQQHYQQQQQHYQPQQQQYQPQGYDQPSPQHNGSDELMTGLCKCGGPCTEACCCYWCQISRQYNMILNNTKGLHCGICCLLAWLDICVLDIIGMACQCYLRGRLRKRYNIAEDCFCDFCVVLWCPCCALSQTQWELAMRGDDPGATCSCGEADVPTQMR